MTEDSASYTINGEPPNPGDPGHWLDEAIGAAAVQHFQREAKEAGGLMANDRADPYAAQRERRQAFLADIVEVCRRHQLTFEASEQCDAWGDGGEYTVYFIKELDKDEANLREFLEHFDANYAASLSTPII